MNARQLGCLAVALWAVAGAAHADVNFDGFGQVAVGSTLGNDPNHQMPGFTDPNGLDSAHSHYSADPSFKPDSLFALQVRAPLSNRLSATAQILASGQDSNDFEPKFTWAYASYQINSRWSVRGGRQRLPVLEYSDYLQVGEAYPWIHPPIAVYSSSGAVSNFDGISLVGDLNVGDFFVRPEIYYGDYSGNVSFEGTSSQLTFRNIIGVAVDATYDQRISVSAHFVTVKGTGSNAPQLAQLLAGLNAFGLPGVASGIELNNDTITYAGVGAQVEQGNLFLTGEYQLVKVNETFSSRYRNYYVSAGWHFGPFMPLVTFSHEDAASSNPSVVEQAAPLLMVPGGQGIALYQGVVGLIQSQRRLDDFYQIGACLDITRNSALKLEYVRFISAIPSPNAAGTPSSANLLSAAFVFSF